MPIGLLVDAMSNNERVLSGFGAALAGIIQCARHLWPVRNGLSVIAAVVIGGTSIMGGNGSVARRVLGVFFLGVINNEYLRRAIDIQLIARGAIIVIALTLAPGRSQGAVAPGI
jgi:ribose/xylose/arabinose/galactoside ABC-type transport system permease subunit